MPNNKKKKGKKCKRSKSSSKQSTEEDMDVLIRHIKKSKKFTESSDRPNVSNKINNELNPIQNLMTGSHESIESDVVGKLILNDSSINPLIVTVHVVDQEIVLQLSNLPPVFWYKIQSKKQFDRFISDYTCENISIKLSDSKKVESGDNNTKVSDEEDVEDAYELCKRYDLKRNQYYRPIMIERYMITSPFTDGIVWGPTSRGEIRHMAKNTSSFDLSILYYRYLRQFEDSFIISTNTRYSKSQVTVKITNIGVTCDIYYDPIDNRGMGDLIERINETMNCDFDTELPIDVILFLLPFKPIDCKRIMEQIEQRDIFPDSNIISVVEHLSAIESDSKQLIDRMKIICRELEENMTIVLRESDRAILKDQARIAITREYIYNAIIRHDDIEDQVTKNAKVVSDVISTMKSDNNFEFMDKQYMISRLGIERLNAK